MCLCERGPRSVLFMRRNSDIHTHAPHNNKTKQQGARRKERMRKLVGCGVGAERVASSPESRQHSIVTSSPGGPLALDAAAADRMSDRLFCH